jgi:hypothetical protein
MQRLSSPGDQILCAKSTVALLRRSFLKERGWSRPVDWLFSLFCGLPGPGLGALK